jgi:isocitrate dehydrogenase
MTYIAGEEMSRYCMKLCVERWVEPHVDTSAWEYFDLSCKARDETKDKVLHDAVASGKKLTAIFKEPTITPSAEQQKEFGLSGPLPSPNGAMRRGWNGITISRDTIHIPGLKFGYDAPVLFDRHAVGGEYGAGFKSVSSGRVVTTFFPDDLESEAVQIVDARALKDKENAVVLYHNPLDNVPDLSEIFFSRCLEKKVVPYVVTKKTVFKWQDGFWVKMKAVFDAKYKDKFIAAGLLPAGELQHLISDAATMQILRWTGGGFGMASHNYDGDMLTDEIAQVHRSPGFITSNLTGRREDGVLIREYEASHGTVADLWHAHLRGEETSMNPLGMVEALLGAMDAAAENSGKNVAETTAYTKAVRAAMHMAFQSGKGTRDLCGPTGATTEEFVDAVAQTLESYLMGSMSMPLLTELDKNPSMPTTKPDVALAPSAKEKIMEMFKKYDTDGDGQIDFEEFTHMVTKLGVAPRE